MSNLPWTPDFNNYPIKTAIKRAIAKETFINVVWADGLESQYDVFLLRENSPEPEIIHPKSREMLISPLDIPCDLQAIAATVSPNGALEIEWSSGQISQYHPGWLREIAWFDDSGAGQSLPLLTEHIHWDAENLIEPHSFDGPGALANNEALLVWLEALNTFGIARLRGFPNQDGLLETVVRTIGPIRESNFGSQYVLEIKDEPDSNAFTSGALLQHIDMPTRECPHGLQFLFCRENTTSGGEGVYVDGFRIAEVLRDNEPSVFKSLTEISWIFNNRSRTSDYRAQGPVISLDAQGHVNEIRLTAWLRAPLKASLEIQQQAYRAVRVFTAYAQNPKYQLIFRYEPGDLLSFDNRRILHGRRSYSASHGSRYIEGIYSDRDELHSRIRTLRRDISKPSNE